jgi:hypothetical protein
MLYFTGQMYVNPCNKENVLEKFLIKQGPGITDPGPHNADIGTSMILLTL